MTETILTMQAMPLSRRIRRRQTHHGVCGGRGGKNTGHSDWKWHSGAHSSSCSPGCSSSHGHWEDEGEYVDEGWWEFDLDRYSASLSASMELSTDEKSPTATDTTIKSGYGVNILVNASASTSQSSATTPPQTAVSYFPEFYYKTYWRLLERTRSGYHAGFEFKTIPPITAGHTSHPSGCRMAPIRSTPIYWTAGHRMECFV